MGESDRYHDYRRTARRRFTLGQPGNALFTLFAINMVGFFLILLANVFSLYTHQKEVGYTGNGIEWFAVPANLTTLSERPWTLLTFMFSQGGGTPFGLLLTMLSTMMWLWAFGYILQDLSGNRYIFPVYIYGSLLGAILFIIAANTIPIFGQYKNQLFLFGAQTGTTAMAVAVTTLSPGYRLFKNIGNGIPVWVLTGIYMILNLYAALNAANASSFAILGAGIAGFLFVWLLRKGKDTGEWMHNFYNWCGTLFNPNKQQQKKVREKIFYTSGSTPPFNKKAHITQQRIDEILDKINQKGYHFLTEEEKTILKRASETDL
jgi:hypothetical protein